MPYTAHSIPNLHDGPKRTCVTVRINDDVYNYFFRYVLPGDHGARQAFMSHFFQRFYEACVEEGIKPVWDEENEGRVHEVLKRINFKVPTKGKKVK